MNWNDVIHFANNGNPPPNKRVEKTEKEWQKVLSTEQFYVTRKKGTERAFSGAYCESHQPGRYQCLCCNEPLFDAGLKFESRSGWPSFTEPINENAIQYHRDASHGMERIEVQCNTCDAHLGHVFPDGPEPSGLRFCINSISILLAEDTTAS